MDLSENKIQLLTRIAQRFAINLPDEKDRIKAVKWIKKIDSAKDSKSTKTKLHALQLLLCCLQKKLLVGPFEKAPTHNKSLPDHNWAYQPHDIARIVLEHEFNKMGKPPVTIEVSGDLTEFVSFQQIPSFGAHFFYAYSPEEMRKWDNLDKSFVPRGLLNVTILLSPDTSILARTVQSNIENRQLNMKKIQKQVRDNGKMPQGFHDVSIVDENAAQLKEGFINQVPEAKGAVQADALQKAMTSGIVRREDLGMDIAIAEEVAKGKNAHIEKVTVTKRDTKIAEKKYVKHMGSKKDANTFEAKIRHVEEKRDAERESQLAKLPARLRERLSRKYVNTEEEKALRTPEIFRQMKDHYKREKYRKYKPEEFGLTADEKFMPAEQFVRGLEYKAPKRKVRRSPVPDDVLKFMRRSFGSPEAIPSGLLRQQRQLETTEIAEDGESPTSKDVRLSLERSWERIQQTKLMQQPQEESRTSTPRTHLLQRLEEIKQNQPRRIIFDDVDVNITPEEISFERFVYKELPECELNSSILEEDEMQMEDVFGEQAVEDVSKLSIPAPIEALEQAEILLEREMKTDDLFTGEDVVDPKVIFREVVVEGDRYASPTIDGSSAKTGSVRIGRRTLNIPGEEPTTQTFVEESGDIVFDQSLRAVKPGTYTPPLTDSMLNRILDEKLRILKPGQTPSRHYGPLAEKFLSLIERIEKGGSSTESTEDSDLLQEYEMNLSDEIFEPGTPELIQQRRFKKHKEQAQRIEDLKTQFKIHKKRISDTPKPLEDGEDLLEPLIFSTPGYEPPGLMDTSLDSTELFDLHAPLVKGLDIKRKGVLEEYEEQLNRSLVLLYGDTDMMPPNIGDEIKVFQDPDFLERRIFEIPAELSIISESEMEDLGEPMEVEKNIDDELRPSPLATAPLRHSHLYLTSKRSKRTIEDILPFERIEEESLPEDELAMSSILLESEIAERMAAEEQRKLDAQVTVELEKLMAEPVSPATKRLHDENKRQMERIKTIRDQYNSHKKLKQTKPTVKTKAAKIYRGHTEPPGLPGVPGPSGLRRVEWESLEKDTTADSSQAFPISPRRQKEFEEALEEKIDQQWLQEQIDALCTLDGSIIKDSEMQDIFTEDQIAEPSPLHQIPMPSAITSTPKRISPLRSHFYYDRPPKDSLEYRVTHERLDEQCYPSEAIEIDSVADTHYLDEILEEQSFPLETDMGDFDESSHYLTPLSHILEDESEDLGVLDIDQLLPNDIIPEEEIATAEAIKDDTDVYLSIARSVAASKKLQELKRKIKGKRGSLLLEDGEEVKDALKEFYERQKIIDNLGLMDQEIQETITQRPLIKEPVMVQPLNVIEEFERNMNFISRARQLDKWRKQMQEESRKIAEGIGQEAILIQDENELIQELEDLDWEVEEPEPLSKIPMPSDKHRMFVDDLEETLFPEDTSFEYEEEEVPEYTREQFEREIKEEQRQKRGQEATLLQQEMQTASRLRAKRQQREEFKRKIDLSPIAEVLDEKDLSQLSEVEEGLEDATSQFDTSYKEDPFANFEANTDYYIVQDLGEQISAFASPLTPSEMADFGEEDVEEPMPAHEYFKRIKDAFEYEEKVQDYSEPEEMEVLDEFYGLTVKYGLPLSPTPKALSRSMRQSIVTGDLIQKYKRMKGIPQVSRLSELPNTRRYLELEEDLMEPITPGVMNIENGLLDESLSDDEFVSALIELPQTPVNAIEAYERELEHPELLHSSILSGPLSILSESALEDTFSETAIPTQMRDISMPTPPSAKPPPKYISPGYQPYRREIREVLPSEYLSEEEFSGFESFLERTPPKEISGQELFYKSALDQHQTPEVDLSLRLGPQEIVTEQKSSDDVPLEQIPQDLPEENLVYQSVFEQNSTTEITSQLDESSELLLPQIPKQDYLQFDDSIGPPNEFANYQITKEFGISPQRLAGESLATFSPPVGFASPPINLHQGISPGTPKIPPLTKTSRRLFQDGQPSRSPITLGERFDIAGAAPPRQISLRLSPAERIRQLITRQPRFEQIPIRRHEYAPLEFITKPSPEEEDFIETETLPDLPYEAEDIEFGDLYRAVYIPTKSEEKEIQEHLAKRQVSESSPRRQSIDSQIGKIWISPGEEGFKWLENYVPSQEFERGLSAPKTRAEVLRKVTFAAEPQMVSFEPSASMVNISKQHYTPRPPRVAGLLHPHLSQSKKDYMPHTTPNKNSEVSPQVMSLSRPRLARQTKPSDDMPNVPKKILKTLPRVASLQHPRINRQQKQQQLASITSRQNLSKSVEIRTPTFNKGPPQSRCEIIHGKENETSKIEVVKTVESGKEIIKTAAEHVRGNNQPQVKSKPTARIVVPSFARSKIQEPDLNGQSKSVDNTTLKQTMTTRTIGKEKVVAKKSSLAFEKKAVSNTKKVMRHSAITLKDGAKTRTSISKLSVNKRSSNWQKS